MDQEKRIQEERNDLLKIVAMICMVTDHVGAIFFPGMDWLRIIGRLAFPIFAYSLSTGAKYTSSRNRYMLRLWWFAILSQVPYTLLWDTKSLNILFVLFLSLFWIRLGWEYFLLFCLLSFFVSMDYGLYGILMAPIFYWLANRKHIAFLLLTLSTIAFAWYKDVWIQLYAIAGFLLVLYMPKTRLKIRLHKRFFYWFYPLHLIILLVIKYAF